MECGADVTYGPRASKRIQRPAGLRPLAEMITAKSSNVLNKGFISDWWAAGLGFGIRILNLNLLRLSWKRILPCMPFRFKEECKGPQNQNTS